MEQRDVERILAACPLCKGKGTVEDTYMEHGDWVALTSEKPCYHCNWVRKVIIEMTAGRYEGES